MFSLNLLSFLLTLFIKHVSCKSNLTLKYVVEIARHGARSPMWNNLDYSAWRLKSELDNVGMRQHYLIGKELQKRYITGERKFLSFEYDPDEIKVFTSSSSRTLLSAQSQLFGLYEGLGEEMDDFWSFNAETDLPPIKVENGEEILKNLGKKALPNRFRPIPYYSLEPRFYSAIEPDCPKISKLRDLVRRGPVANNFTSFLNRSGFFEKFAKTFNISSLGSIDVFTIGDYFDTLVCDKYAQRPLNITNDLYEYMEFVYDFKSLYMDFGSLEISRLYASPMLSDIKKRIEAKLNDSSNKEKLLIYSAHDDNLRSVLQSLGISSHTTNFTEWKNPTTSFTHANPKFASTIFIEIYESNDHQRFFRFIYNDSEIQISTCSKNELCSLDKLFAVLDGLIYTDKDYKAVCFDSKNLRQVQ